MTAGRDLTPGTIVAEKYEIKSVLGRGGSATVYLAAGVDSGNKVALKVMHDGLPDGVGERERFAREVALVEQLRHPHIVRLLDYGYTAEDMPYLAFTLLVGRSLEQRLRDEGGLEWLEVGRLSAQVLRALDKAHSLGIVHRDVKPANIYLVRTPIGEVAQVLDFGLAKTMGENSDEQLTRVGSVLGTPRYLSPEQARGESVGPGADIYSFGLVMAEMLSGTPVVSGATHFEMFVHHGSDTAHQLPLEVLDTPFAAIIRRATDKVPTVRYRLASQMLVDVEAALERLEEGNEDDEGEDDEGDFIATKMLDPSQAMLPTGEGTAASEQLRRAFNLLARKSRPGAKKSPGGSAVAASVRPTAGDDRTSKSPLSSDGRPTRRPGAGAPAAGTPDVADLRAIAAAPLAGAGQGVPAAIDDPDSEPEPATCVADFDMLGLAAGAPTAQPQQQPQPQFQQQPQPQFQPQPQHQHQPLAGNAAATGAPQPLPANPLHLPLGTGGQRGAEPHTVLFGEAGWPPQSAASDGPGAGAVDLGATAFLPSDEDTFEPPLPLPTPPPAAGRGQAAFARGGAEPSSAWASIPPPAETLPVVVSGTKRRGFGGLLLLIILGGLLASAIGAAVRIWLWP